MSAVAFRRILLVLLVLVGGVYVGKTWSPSSYGHVLKNHLAYEDAHPDWGHPRPVRSDEWAVVTPLTQATVRNHFERYNHTSLYQEDLRINYGLPIADWGRIFKPTMGLYGWVNPAYAYSFHWFAIFALFIGGYALLFKRLGANDAMALVMAFGLYFTGYSQFWWNEKGPLFAIFPWVVLPFLFKLRPAWQLAGFYYAAVCWLLTNFYPPIQISLAFVGLVLVLALQPRILKPALLLPVLLAAALAAGTAAAYLWDYLQGTSATLYPGGRHFPGGGVPYRFFLSWIFPAVNFSRGYESLIGINMSELGMVGMSYYLAALCFIDFSKLPRLWHNTAQRRVFLLLLLAFLLQLAWMALPVPANMGMVFLWDNVQPLRMQFATGVLLTLLLFYMAHTLGLVMAWWRLAVLALVVVSGWWLFKYPLAHRAWEDLLFLPLIGMAFVVARRFSAQAHVTVALASLAFGALIFGRFNPLQPAWPIFNLQANEVVNYLQQSERQNQGVLVVTDLPGAVANGLGFRALGHVTPVPHMDFWAQQFPEIPHDALNTLFNRYSHINPSLVAQPWLRQADAVEVPAERFSTLMSASLVANAEPRLRVQGQFAMADRRPERLVLSGWGGWSGAMQARRIEVVVEPAVAGKLEWIPFIRADLPINSQHQISALNGFYLAMPWTGDKLPSCLSLIAVDGGTGARSIMANPPEIPLCAAGAPAH